MKHLFCCTLVLATLSVAGTSFGHAQQAKQLDVKKIVVTAPVEAQAVPALLDENGVEFQPIDQVNWKEFPYKPQASFRIAHTGKEILVHYRVTEASVRAVAPTDNGKVWEDACAEFSCRPRATTATTTLSATAPPSCSYRADVRATVPWPTLPWWPR